MTTLVEHARQVLPMGLSGRIDRVVGLTAAVIGFPAPLGARCAIDRDHGQAIEADVVGFRGEETLLMPLGELTGVRRGARVRLMESVPCVNVGAGLLGRIIGSRGQFLDEGPKPLLAHRADLHNKPPGPLERPRIAKIWQTGVKAIDGLLTCGEGQRMGIFAGSGVGKSTLLGQLARHSSADVNVVALIGERGREVREFLDRDLGPEGLARSVVIVATGDEPAILRLRAAWMATAIAEHFRDEGRRVVLMMDSVTRFALAQREIGLAAGEPPATRGYPPSVFAMLPRLLERSGCSPTGSITGLYTVLVEGDDTNEPIADSVRGILDGHIVLSRKLAQQGQYPAIDVLQSISRSMNDITPVEHRQWAQVVRQLMSSYQQNEDLISIGAYQSGSNAMIDAAIQARSQILSYLAQKPHEQTPFKENLAMLERLARLRDLLGRKPAAANT
ncbi:MAG: EscN/YscN/HrcN family type III secretion system ATPase [Planctomyces sp.]|nr:EscN/YscN/HrcN family type III secretion system ATPase [Planctomyces sp.]